MAYCIDFNKFNQIAREAGLDAERVSTRKWRMHGVFTAEYDSVTQRVCIPGKTLACRGDPYDAVRLANGTRSSFSDTREERRQYPEIRKHLWVKCPRCHYCEIEMSFEEASLDHFIPLSKGGRSHPDNFVLSCVPCNRWKANDIVVEVSTATE